MNETILRALTEYIASMLGVTSSGEVNNVKVGINDIYEAIKGATFCSIRPIGNTCILNGVDCLAGCSGDVASCQALLVFAGISMSSIAECNYAAKRAANAPAPGSALSPVLALDDMDEAKARMIVNTFRSKYEIAVANTAFGERPPLKEDFYEKHMTDEIDKAIMFLSGLERARVASSPSPRKFENFMEQDDEEAENFTASFGK